MQQHKEVTENNKCTSIISAKGVLKRQPTKYPHGLGISVQTVNEDRMNYSRASTLRSSKKQQQIIMETNEAPQLNIIGSSEHLKELQVRRFKYPLKGSYYLDTQETYKATSPFEFISNINSFCTRRSYRLFLVLLACILLCFGLISYCIWLHNISLARAQFKLQIEQQQSENDGITFFDDKNFENFETTSEYVQDYERNFHEIYPTEPAVHHNMNNQNIFSANIEVSVKFL